MRSESFYTTVAQVLPTLLIPLAVEFLSLRRSHLRKVLEMPPEEFSPRTFRRNRLLGVGITFLGVFVCLAENCAILVVLIGTDNWLPVLAGPFCTLAVVALTVSVTWILLARIVKDWNSLRPE